MDPTLMILLVMAASGALGGLMSYFLAGPSQSPPLPWWQHCVLGIGAALVIPLFLNSISATLIDEIIGANGRPADHSKLLILVGFCLLAAIISRRFIDTLSRRVFTQLEENKHQIEETKIEVGQAKEIAVRAKNAVAPFEEAEISDVDESAVTGDEDRANITDNEKKVVAALINSRFPMRSLSGAAKDAGLHKDVTNQVITDLMRKGYVAQGEASSGQARWYATTKGRSINA